MITLFLDTNIYLHAKPVTDIPWSDLVRDNVLILVPRITVQELDEQKDTNKRQTLRDRARRTLRQIEAWTTPTRLRDGVTIAYLHDEPDDLPVGLRRERSDDVLIATILNYQATHPDEHLVLITNDTGPRLTARHHNLVAQELEEQYLHPSMPDALEEENKAIKKQLQELTSAAPQLHLSLNGQSSVTAAPVLSPTPASVDDAGIAAQAAEARAALPVFTRTVGPEPEQAATLRNGKLLLDLTKQVTFNPEAIASSEYHRYNKESAQYETDYGTYLHERLKVQQLRARTISIAITLHNTGGKPAEDITVEITFPSNITITTDAPTWSGPPRKPTPPRTTGEILADSVQRGFGINTELPRFPEIDQGGPWIEERTISWWVRSLKHGFQRELTRIYLIIAGALQPFPATVTVHAANAIKPFTQEIIIKPTASSR